MASAADEFTFGDDVNFLRQHADVIVLSDETQRAQVAVVPLYQGRVMTSTAEGGRGVSFGWINRALVASGERQRHINVFGGEDRFWLGPEGGQYSIYFRAEDPFDLAHWQVPGPIDWGAWQVVSQAADAVTVRQPIELVNYSGSRFQLLAERTIRLIPAAQIGGRLSVEVGRGVKAVAYESDNQVRNTGSSAWKKESGLLSIWILGMFQPSPQTTVVIPFQPGTAADVGLIVNDAYFGRVPPDRLTIHAEKGVLFFRGDGQYRSKIGIPRPRAKAVMGSYDAMRQVLTVVQLSLPDDALDYVNSMWEVQKDPYAGDVVNSYNDGPPSPGAKPLGPFYELESSSPALALQPGQSAQHVHRTFHFLGPEVELDVISREVLGARLHEIREAFR
jgi:hypothetical protein